MPRPAATASDLQLSLFDAAASSETDEAPATPPAAAAPASSAAVPMPIPAVHASSATFRHPQADREIRLGEHLVAYALKRARRRSIGFIVGAEGLSVNAPRWVGLGDIESALMRRAGADAETIAVAVDGGDVTLSGTVHGWDERELAIRTAWRASGATTSTTGNAISQAVSQLPAQWRTKSGSRPVERNVEIPETSSDISPESIRPKSMGAYFLGNMKDLSMGEDDGCRRRERLAQRDNQARRPAQR